MLLTQRMDNLVVLLIDMQLGFLTSSEERKIIPNQITVLNFCKQTNTPVILIEYGDMGMTVPSLLKIAKQIPSYRYIRKEQDCAFSVSKLEDFLREFKAKKLLLMGVRAERCVYKTAKEAVNRGYQVLTSDTLIAGYRLFDEKEIVSWYKENTVYHSEKVLEPS